MNTFIARALVLAVCGIAAAGVASAADYPSKPIRIVVTYPPGGGMDVMGRMIAVPLGKRLKEQIVIDNRPGASGMIGSEHVARSAPDGYTVILAPADTHSINPHVYTNIRYDALKDFEPVAFLGSFPMALVVNPKVDAKSVADFEKLVASRPGKMTYASWGIGSSSHVEMEVLLFNGGLKMLHVPFTGAAPAVTAVIAGDVDSMMVTLPTAEPHHIAGKIRILGVTPTHRPAGAATYPSEGMPTDIVLWMGVLAPAKTPRAIVNRLNHELAAVMKEHELRASLEKAGLEPASKVGSPGEFRKFLVSQSEAWGKTIKAAHITMELK
jgi:tripartite-type tricarboxylate transporter receptor subunit TctC